MKFDDLVGAAVVDAVDDSGQQMRQPDKAVLANLPEQVLFLENKDFRKNGLIGVSLKFTFTENGSGAHSPNRIFT